MSSQILETARAGRRVLVGEKVVRDLRMLAIEGLAALRRRGLEVGGILFGEADSEEVRIETFVEAKCEHRFGPSYRLSELDREKLGELLEESRRGPVPILGFFQSFTSREPVIDDGAEALMREHFPHGDAVFLMVQPLSVEICVARFRFFRDGEALSDSGNALFALDPRHMATVMAPPEPLRAPLPTPYRRREDETADGAPDLTPDLAQIGEPGIPVLEAKPTPHRRVRWWIPVAVCLLVGATGAVISGLGTLMTKPPQQLAAVPKLTITPPQAATSQAVPPQAVPPQAATPQAATPQVATSQVATSQAAPPAEAGPVAPAPAAPAKPAKVEVAATPPVAVHELQPAVPAGIRARIGGEILMPVKVDVNERGRVVRAVAESRGGDGVRRYLADLAQKAAREWQFAPARSSSGAAVPGKRTIQFVFKP